MQNKIKKEYYLRFFNNRINQTFLYTLTLIIFLRLLFMYSNSIINALKNLYTTINDSQLWVGITTSCITFIPLIFSYIREKVKTKNKESSKFSISDIDKKSKIFPTLVDKERVYSDIFSLKEEVCEGDKIKDNDLILLDRENQCKNIIKFANAIKCIKNELNCLYFIGQSGSGKSTLLKFLIENNLKKSGEKCAIINDKYYEYDLIYEELHFGKYTIIIMDKFENSLNNPGIYKCIKNLVENSEKELLFIFSFSQEYFEKIHMTLTKLFEKKHDDIHSINFNTYFLQIDKHDINQFKKIIVRFLDEDGGVDECLREGRRKIRTLYNKHLKTPKKAFIKPTVRI